MSRGAPVLIASVLVGVAALLTLASPAPDPARAAEKCIYLIPLPRGFQLAFGCDGFTFLRGAVSPSLLLEPDFAPPSDFTYQSRPLHIGLAALLGRVLQPVAGLAIPPDARYQGRTPVRRFAGAYVAYVLINAGLLVVAGIVLHDALIGWTRVTARETAALLAALAFVILSPTVKAWLFTPHTVLWGVAIPLWALAVGRRILARAAPARPGVPLRAGVASGIAALAYGYAVLVPAVSVLAVGVRLGAGDVPRGRLARWLRVAIPTVALFVLPTLAWIAISYGVAGGYYHHEAVLYRQFRWLPDALSVGPTAALAEAAARARRWAMVVAVQWTIPVVFLTALVAASVATGGSLRRFAKRQRALLEAATIVLVLGLAFWYLDGETSSGRAATLAPVVQVVAASLALDLDRHGGRTLWTGVLAAATLVVGAATMLLGRLP